MSYVKNDRNLQALSTLNWFLSHCEYFQPPQLTENSKTNCQRKLPKQHQSDHCWLTHVSWWQRREWRLWLSLTWSSSCWEWSCVMSTWWVEGRIWGRRRSRPKDCDKHKYGHFIISPQKIIWYCLRVSNNLIMLYILIRMLKVFIIVYRCYNNCMYCNFVIISLRKLFGTVPGWPEYYF